MSFYGSVYYQLIDTFYKIIVKNGGDKNPGFNEELINPSDTPDSEIIESPAIGRKGVFSLDSGNYWINFSKTEGVDESAPYKIWHSPARDNVKTMKRVSSWDMVNDNFVSDINEATGVEEGLYLASDTEKKNNLLELEDEKQKEFFIQLQEHDFLKTYESNYDEAGHIIGGQTSPIIYRLPKPKMSDKVNIVIDYVGEPNADNKIPLKWNSQPEDGITLTECVEQNWDHVNLLHDYIGKAGTKGDLDTEGKEWPSIVSETMWKAYKPSIIDVIGVYENLFYDIDNPDKTSTIYQLYCQTKDTKLNLTKIIGQLPKLWKKLKGNTDYDKLTPISLVDSIVENREKIETEIEDRIREISRLDVSDTGINTRIDGLVGIVGKSSLGTNEDRDIFDIIGTSEVRDVLHNTKQEGGKDIAKPIYEDLDNIYNIIGKDQDSEIDARGSIYPAIENLHDIIGIDKLEGDNKRDIYSIIGNDRPELHNPTKPTIGGEINHFYKTIGESSNRNAKYEIKPIYEETDRIYELIGVSERLEDDKNYKPKNLYGETDNIYSIIGISGRREDEVKSLYPEIDNIYNIIGIDEKNRGSIYPSIENLHSRIDLEVSNLKAADSALQTNIGNEEKERIRVVGELNGRISEIDAQHTKDKGELDESILNLSTRHDNELKTVNSSIEDLNNKHNTLNENYNNYVTHIETLYGNASDNSTSTLYGKVNINSKAISDINTSISNINTSIGNNNESNSILGRITTAESNINGINESISDITSLIGDDTKIEDLLTRINSLIGSGSLVEGQDIITLLTGILQNIEEIKGEVEVIKDKINELHPGSPEDDNSSYPFPESKENDEPSSEI